LILCFGSFNIERLSIERAGQGPQIRNAYDAVALAVHAGKSKKRRNKKKEAAAAAAAVSTA
jgi:hypothetical protein